MGSSIGFSDDGVQDQGWRIFFASLIGIIGSGIFVISRIAMRFKSHQLGADDYAIVASLVFSVIMSIAMQLAVAHGYGRHKADIPKPQLHQALFWFFIEQIQYKMVICLNKISILLLYKRIFIPRIFQIQCWVVMSIIISWTIASVGATIWQCVPVEGAWNSTIDATCIDTSKFWMGYAITNILTDAIVLFLPIPEVWKLHLNLRQKISLSGVFLLGSFVILCSIMRIFAVIENDKGHDTTWDFVPRNVWSLVETNVGIVCACLPVLKSPFLKGLSILFRTTHKSTSLNGHGSAYELRDGSRQHGHLRSNHRTRTKSKTPWENVSNDGASDEVEIIGGSEARTTRGDNELDFGFDKHQIQVTKEIKLEQNGT